MKRNSHFEVNTRLQWCFNSVFCWSWNLRWNYYQMSQNWNYWNWIHYWNWLHCWNRIYQWNWLHQWNWLQYCNWLHKLTLLYDSSFQGLGTSLPLPMHVSDRESKNHLWRLFTSGTHSLTESYTFYTQPGQNRIHLWNWLQQWNRLQI